MSLIWLVKLLMIWMINTFSVGGLILTQWNISDPLVYEDVLFVDVYAASLHVTVKEADSQPSVSACCLVFVFVLNLFKSNFLAKTGCMRWHNRWPCHSVCFHMCICTNWLALDTSDVPVVLTLAFGITVRRLESSWDEPVYSTVVNLWYKLDLKRHSSFHIPLNWRNCGSSSRQNYKRKHKAEAFVVLSTYFQHFPLVFLSGCLVAFFYYTITLHPLLLQWYNDTWLNILHHLLVISMN